MLTKQLFLSVLPLGALALPFGFPGILQTRQSTNSSTTNTTTTNGTRSTSTSEIVATAWYPSWLGKTYTPDKISWSKYTTMTFAFALTTPDSSVISLDADSKELLPTFVSYAKNNSVKALLSIGGWTGSQYFSSAVATEANRTAFVKAIVDLAKEYNLDGIDFDWEFPNKQGLGCNLIDSKDSENFLSFLQELKKDSTGSQLIISAAVGTTPFSGSDGQPMTDVSGFSDVLDFIAIMAYDIWGSWSTNVGPNAPLNDACAPSPAGSGVSAVEAWTGANFPVDKLVLGVASYGRSYGVSQSEASKIGNYPTFDASNIPLGENETGQAGIDQCGNPVPGKTGLFNFEGLIKAGYLTSNGTAASGKTYQFDTCSQTPFLYDNETQVMVSYDDAASFAAKGQFINEKGLKGFAMWHAIGDSDDILLDSIRNAMQIERKHC